MPSLEDIRKVIFAKVGVGLEGDDDVDAILLDKVTPLFEILWGKWAWKAYYPGLQELYVSVDCVDILSGQLRTQINISLGTALSIDKSRLVSNLQAIRANLQGQIAEAEATARNNRFPEIGQMRRPETVSPYRPDPGAAAYRGDPRIRTWGRT